MPDRLPGTSPGGGFDGLTRLPGTAPGGGGVGLSRLPGTGASVSGFDIPFQYKGKIRTYQDLQKFQQARKDWLNRYANNLITMGVPRAAALSAAEVAWQRQIQHTDRPSSFLNVVGRVFSAPQQFVAGALSAQSEALHVSANPWDTVKSLGESFGAAVEGGVRGVQKKKGVEAYVRENYPGAPGVLGLGASIVFDPVMYVSFGATIPSKIGASRMLAHSYQQAATQANKILARKGASKGMYWGTRYTDPLELTQAIRRAEGYPMNMPQALDMYRGFGIDYKANMRRLQPIEAFGETIKPTVGRVLGAYAFPTAVRGGRGVRFGGIEVPGTAALGEKLGGLARGKLEEELIQQNSPIAQALTHGLVTHAGLRIMGEDTVRALALTEMAVYKAELQGAKLTAIEEARRVGRGGEEGGRKAYIPLKERRGALEAPIYPRMDVLAPKTRAMVDLVKAGVDDLVERAHAVKIPRNQSQEMWQTIKSQTDDPVEAFGRFYFQQEIAIKAREFVSKRILGNPIFAKPLEEGEVLPMGYKRFTDPVTKQKYAVLGDMHDALEQVVNPQVIDKSITAAMQSLGMLQNYWKQFATSANPSFHVMNFLGAIWNNMYGMVYNPGDYVRALTTLYNARMAERVAQTGVELGPVRQAGTRVAEAFGGLPPEEARALFQEATRRGATSETASIYAEMSDTIREVRAMRGKPEDFLPQLPPTVNARVEDMLRRRPRESRKRYALRQSRRASAVGLLATGNPVGVALLAPEAAAVGRKLGTTIEDIVRLAPFMKAAKDPVLMRYLDAFGPIRVPGMVHPGMSKEEQAVLYDIGASISKHFQFDYSDLTEFERRWAKLIFPFYVFYKKNFLLQMQLLATAPRGVHTAQAVMNYMNENGDLSPEMQQLLPEYFDQISAFQIPVPTGMRKKLGLPTDQPLFLNPKLPFVSLNLMPPLWQAWGNTAQPTSQKVLGIFAPMLGSIGPFAPLPLPGMKLMLEAAVGEQLGLNKTLDYQRSQSNDYRNSWVPAPAWVSYLPGPVRDFMGIFPWGKTVKTEKGYLMTATGQYLLSQMSTPFVNNLGQVIPAQGQESGKTKADMISWLSGVRLIPVDMLRMHRSWAYRLESMLEGERADLRDQGKDLSPQDQETLTMVRAQIKVLEAAWDLKQEELYGREEK